MECMDSQQHILIVEDDQGLNKLLQRIINREGFNTEGALSGFEAMEHIKNQDFILLLLDYKLSDMSADQFLDNLKGIGKSVPFIIMTGHGNEYIAVRMMKMGAKDYLIKEGDYLAAIPRTVKRLASELEMKQKYMESQRQLKESQAKLKLEHEQLLSIYESITEPICITDLNSYEIIFSNSAFRKHFGNIKDGQKCYMHIYHFEEQCKFCPILQLQNQDMDTFYGEVYNKVNNHWYRYINKIIHWPTEEKVYFSLAVDITNIKQSEQELIKAKEKAEESDRLKSAFLANMSHEIRTPMNTIIGFSDLLVKRDYDTGKQKKILKMINQRSKDLLQIINDILDSSRIEVGLLDIKESEVNLNVLLEDIYQYYRAKESLLTNENVIDLRKKLFLPSRQCLVKTDFIRIKQVICNLIDNAYKYTTSGYIEFGCVLIGKDLRFYVKDTGTGISKDKQILIFDRFRQANETFLNGNTKGTGLGLSISKALIELMGGKIWVESAIDKGSTFYFTIPFIPIIKFDKDLNKIRQKKYSWKNKTLVVVEDDLYDITLLSLYLASTKAKCLFATSKKELMDIFNSHPEIDLILMNIHLSDVNVLELIRQIKSTKPSITIIAQTAHASKKDEELILKSGCNAYISKPIIQENLKNAIDNCFYNLNVP